jgi:cell division protein FtsW (lipid II flippase)
MLLHVGRDLYVYFDGGGARRWVSLNDVVAGEFTKTATNFFGAEYLPLPPRLRQNATIDVCTFLSVLLISTVSFLYFYKQLNEIN